MRGEVAVIRPGALIAVARAGVYTASSGETVSALDRILVALIDAEYPRHPFYGSRRRVVVLKAPGHAVNRQRVPRLMGILGLAGMAPGPATSDPHPAPQVYPDLRRGVAVTRPNPVWSTDLTSMRLTHGFAYRVAIVAGYARRVLAWQLSNTLAAGFCVDGLEDALRADGRPEIFHTAHGSQFTSAVFTGILLREGIAISMDGRGRALDNLFVERWWRRVKYEDLSLKRYASLSELLLGLTGDFACYHHERPHPSLGYLTPEAISRSRAGGGAKSVDRCGRAESELGPRQTAAIEVASTT